MKNVIVGMKLRVIKGDFWGEVVTVISRDRFEKLYGKFRVPDNAIFAESESGVIFWCSPDEVEQA